MLDIDHFKKYNDTYGHPAGDRLLVEIANILLKEKREADFVARYGGEEFLIILTKTGVAEGYTVAERIRKTIEESTVITASLGAASYSKDISSIKDLICKADNALYRAKQKGRNRVKVSA